MKRTLTRLTLCVVCLCGVTSSLAAQDAGKPQPKLDESLKELEWLIGKCEVDPMRWTVLGKN